MAPVTAVETLPVTRGHVGPCGHRWTRALSARVVAAWERDTGRTFDDLTDAEAAEVAPANWRPLGCPECAAARQAPATVVSDRSTDILEHLDRAGVNVPKYRDATLETFDASDDPQALAAARRYVDEWKRARRPYPARDWMYLYGAGSSLTDGRLGLGALGNGKTHLAIAIARQLIEDGALDPSRFVFRSAEGILLEAEATFRTNDGDAEIALIRRYARPELLVIDDLGVRSKPSAHAIRVFDELAKKREAHGTIWTSNLSVRVVAATDPALERLADRIVGEVGDGGPFLVEFRGESRRGRRLERRIRAI